MHEKYACKRVEFKQSETEFIINYVSRTIKAISYSDISDANKEEEYSLYQTEWHQYLTDKLLNSETNLSFEMLELLSLLQLVNIIPNMSTLNITLNKMKQMSRGYFFKTFRWYHLKHLFELKLTCLYEGKLKEDDKK